MIICVFVGEFMVIIMKSDKFGLMCVGMIFFKFFVFLGNFVL